MDEGLALEHKVKKYQTRTLKKKEVEEIGEKETAERNINMLQDIRKLPRQLRLLKNFQQDIVGRTIAKRLMDKGIKDVAFDKGGYKYHGLIKILADSARAEGLNF